MRALICTAALAMFSNSAAAQPTTHQATKRPTHNEFLLNEQARVKECLKQWDRSTHMTKQEWEVTCRRVAKERVKHLRE